MSATAMWVIGIVVGTLLSIIGVLVRFSFNQLNYTFKELKKGFNDVLLEVGKIRETLSEHNTDLIKVLSRNDTLSTFTDKNMEEIELLKKEITKINLNCANNQHRKHTKE
jgi:hypothetical protein